MKLTFSVLLVYFEFSHLHETSLDVGIYPVCSMMDYPIGRVGNWLWARAFQGPYDNGSNSDNIDLILIENYN